MIELRWVEIPAGDRRVFDHPAATFVNRQQHSVYRVLQFRQRLSSEAWLGVQSQTDYEVAMRAQEWQDVPVVGEAGL